MRLRSVLIQPPGGGQPDRKAAEDPPPPRDFRGGGRRRSPGSKTAGQIGDFLREAYRFYHHSEGDSAQILLVHAGDELLPEIGPRHWASMRGKMLIERGTEVRLKTKVVAVTARRVHFEDGMAVEANTDVVTTIGSGPESGRAGSGAGLARARRARRAGCGCCRLSACRGTTACGRRATAPAVPWDDRGQAKVSPPTAQFAVRQGVQLAKNILRASREEPLRPFRHRYMGQLAVVGKRHAVAEVMELAFSRADRLVAVADDLPVQAAGHRTPAAGDDRLDLRSLFPARHEPGDAAAQRGPAGGPSGQGRSAVSPRGDLCRGAFLSAQGRRGPAPGRRGRPKPSGAGAVIDGNWVDGDGEVVLLGHREPRPSDLIIFRGLALELFRDGTAAGGPREIAAPAQPATAS